VLDEHYIGTTVANVAKRSNPVWTAGARAAQVGTADHEEFSFDRLPFRY